MNNLDKQYQQLLQDILDNGMKKEDRTGTGTISVFGRQIRHKMSEGFPLLTTKKMPFKTIVTELLWFLRGDTNIKYLVDNGCHIWDGDAYKNYLKLTVDTEPLSQEKFINKIKQNEWEFAKTWGDLGPIYGKQWRSWGYREDLKLVDNNRGNFEYEKVITTGVDQIQNLSPKKLNSFNIPKRAISLMWNQRSVDTFLGLPFNIASYGLLLEIIAKEVNMIPDELIGNLGDVHLYSNHIEQAKEQIGRTDYELPTLNIYGEVDDIAHYEIADFEIKNYQSHPTIKAPLSN
jgi:thymidylate synthase